MIDFNSTYQGKVYTMQGGILYELRDGTFRGVGVDANAPRVELTGYTATSARGNVGYQTKSGRFIILSEGWQFIGNAPIMQYGQPAAQAQVNKIIANNKIIISNNLLCARYAEKLTDDQREAVRTLQNRLMARNAALQNEGLTTNVQSSYPAGYAELSAYLDRLMNGEAVGIATWVVVVIAATVVAATATAAYYWYKDLAEESEKDVKYSKELTQILTSKLTEEEYQQLLDETRGIVTKSKIKASLRSSWNTAQFIAMGFVAYAVYKAIKKRL